jgi:hypothetical protein
LQGLGESFVGSSRAGFSLLVDGHEVDGELYGIEGAFLAIR